MFHEVPQGFLHAFVLTGNCVSMLASLRDAGCDLGCDRWCLQLCGINHRPMAENPFGMARHSRKDVRYWETFHGLPGMLSDSLPDRFGNELINAWLARQGRTPESFNAVERLCYTRTRGMGHWSSPRHLVRSLGGVRIWRSVSSLSWLQRCYPIVTACRDRSVGIGKRRHCAIFSVSGHRPVGRGRKRSLPGIPKPMRSARVRSHRAPNRGELPSTGRRGPPWPAPSTRVRYSNPKSLPLNCCR